MIDAPSRRLCADGEQRVPHDGHRPPVAPADDRVRPRGQAAGVERVQHAVGRDGQVRQGVDALPTVAMILVQ